MPVVNYPFSLDYLPAGPQGGLTPALEVQLIRGPHVTRAVGVIDSGATITVFNPQHAQMLGIEDLSEGELQQYRSQAGQLDYYVFDLEIQIQLQDHQNRFPCRVGFFAAHRPRNILGRDLIFQYYEIGLRDRSQTIHLRPEA